MATTEFEGLPLGMLHFLEQLARNNNRQWFETHKERYESEVRTPILRFISEFARPMRKVSPHFVVSTKKVGGSLMRVYRDVRFSKDKTPYKTNVAVHFRHEAGKDVHAPGFYLHISPEECFLGAGIWRPDSQTLAAIRRRLVEEPARWKRVRDAKRFRSDWDLGGESLKRPPRGYDADHPLIDDLKRKDHIAATPLELDDVFSPDLVERVATRYRQAKAYVGFLCDAIGVPF